MNDEAAMLLVQSGDCEALTLLFDRYSGLVLSIAGRVLRNPAEAQDLLQDVFLYIHRRNDLFDPARGTFAAWVARVAYLRALSRRQHLYVAVATHGSTLENLTHEPADPEKGEARVAERLSARKLVRAGLAELSACQRDVLRLHFFEGYSLREISAKRGMSLANTRHQYYRGIERLRKAVPRGK